MKLPPLDFDCRPTWKKINSSRFFCACPYIFTWMWHGIFFICYKSVYSGSRVIISSSCRMWWIFTMIKYTAVHIWPISYVLNGTIRWFIWSFIQSYISVNVFQNITEILNFIKCHAWFFQLWLHWTYVGFKITLQLLHITMYRHSCGGLEYSNMQVWFLNDLSEYYSHLQD